VVNQNPMPQPVLSEEGPSQKPDVRMPEAVVQVFHWPLLPTGVIVSPNAESDSSAAAGISKHFFIFIVPLSFTISLFFLMVVDVLRINPKV
jgi:hypothetical protein